MKKEPVEIQEMPRKKLGPYGDKLKLDIPKKDMLKKSLKNLQNLPDIKNRTIDSSYKPEGETIEETDKKGKGSGKKDACYHKVKASAKVWPSAYASGRLVQCRKKGAANYGKSSKKESVNFKDFCIEASAAWQRKEGKNKTGGLNEKGRKSYERENPGSDLKAPQPEGGPRKRSFCARMGGVKGPMKKPDGSPTRKALALRKWKC